MNTARLKEMVLSLLSCPTAPYHEEAVSEFITQTVDKIGLRVHRDTFGNLLVRRPSTGRTRNRIGFMAHMDHPGFEVAGVEGNSVVARWYGGVSPDHFDGTAVRFYADGVEYPGIINMVRNTNDDKRVKGVAVECPEPPPVGALGMWDLPGPSLDGDMLHAIAIDDLAGCGILLGILLELGQRPVDTEVWLLFTRAEEDGFIGALGMAKSGVLPRSMPVVSVEMSKALPGVAEQGGGPVIRVGDHTSTFDHSILSLMRKQADLLTAGEGSFHYQMALMHGGSCEGTVMNAYGHRPGALAVPLSNYHNQVPVGPGEPPRLDREGINYRDFRQAITLCAEVCMNYETPESTQKSLRDMLLESGSDGIDKLRRSEPI